MSYAKNAQKYTEEMLLLRAEIDAYRSAHRRDNPKEVRNSLIPLERKLVELEIKISDDYYAMYKQGIDTYEKRNSTHKLLKKDIDTFLEDLTTMREDYIVWHEGWMKQKFPEPLDYEGRVAQARELANYKFKLFQNTREMLKWQNKQISYCKTMNQDDVSRARKRQAKLRQDYETDFNDLFNFTVTGMKTVGMKEAIRLLEVRRGLIEQGQKDYKKDGTGVIIKKPSELQKICDKANRITGYKRKINVDIGLYTFILQQDEEMHREEKEYYESGKAAEDERRAEQEEAARYSKDWVIPDEEYKDEEGNIIRAKEDDDERDI